MIMSTGTFIHTRRSTCVCIPSMYEYHHEYESMGIMYINICSKYEYLHTTSMRTCVCSRNIGMSLGTIRQVSMSRYLPSYHGYERSMRKFV